MSFFFQCFTAEVSFTYFNRCKFDYEQLEPTRTQSSNLHKPIRKVSLVHVNVSASLAKYTSRTGLPSDFTET